MFVKICGITRAEDAGAAVAAGAAAIGFIFWPDSPRFVDPFRARAIAVTLPPFVTAVGVFGVTYLGTMMVAKVPEARGFVRRVLRR